MEDYVNRCTGTKSIKILCISILFCEELHHCRFVQKDIKGISSSVGRTFGYVRRWYSRRSVLGASHYRLSCCQQKTNARCHKRYWMVSCGVTFLLLFPLLYLPFPTPLMFVGYVARLSHSNKSSGEHTDYGRILVIALSYLNTFMNPNWFFFFLLLPIGLLSLVNQDDDITALQVRVFLPSPGSKHMQFFFSYDFLRCRWETLTGSGYRLHLLQAHLFAI